MSSDQSYHLVHTSNMVGLFSCVFIKSSLRSRLKVVDAAEIKRGMGGLHGNKVSWEHPSSAWLMLVGRFGYSFEGR